MPYSRLLDQLTHRNVTSEVVSFELPDALVVLGPSRLDPLVWSPSSPNYFLGACQDPADRPSRGTRSPTSFREFLTRVRYLKLVSRLSLLNYPRTLSHGNELTREVGCMCNVPRHTSMLWSSYYHVEPTIRPLTYIPHNLWNETADSGSIIIHIAYLPPVCRTSLILTGR